MNRKKFYETLGRKLTQQQVNGIEAIMDITGPGHDDLWRL